MAESRGGGPHLPEGLAVDHSPMVLKECAMSRDGSMGVQGWARFLLQ